MPSSSRRSVQRAIQGALLVWLTACAACSHTGAEAASEDAGAEPVLGGDAQASTDAAGAAESPLTACAALSGSSPHSVADVVARINALPEPASIPCLIASLPRPFSVVATNSVFSAQPAGGAKSPRLFIMLDGLIVSIVPAGHAERLVEFGEWVGAQRTLKGELEFPVTRPVAADAPFVRVDQGQSVSVCGFCHSNETPHPTIPRAFVSDAFRVGPRTEVPLTDVRRLREGCDEPAGEGPHCELLRALFDYGDVRQGAFSPSLTTGF